jgi:hypothetical protein
MLTSCEMDPGFVGDAHFLAHPLLVKTFVLLAPKTVFLRNVGVLADETEMTTMLAWVVFVGVMTSLGA